MTQNPLEELSEEHDVIKERIQQGLRASALLPSFPQKYTQEMTGIIHFLKAYADQVHHRKEEDILFPAMIKEREILGVGIIPEMIINHDDMRELLTSCSDFLEKNDLQRAQCKFKQYSEALLDHIAVEEEEVFPTALTLFDRGILEKISMAFARFNEKKPEISGKNI